MQWGGAEEKAQARTVGNQNAVNWHDGAMKVIESAMEGYWNKSEEATTKSRATRLPMSPLAAGLQRPIESELDRHQQFLIKQASHKGMQTMGWPAELHQYLNDLPPRGLHILTLPRDVTKDMDVVQWWSEHASKYPTLAKIAQDVSAIPASSVPCEQLFSLGGEIASDHQSRLGAEKFEEIQVLKHAWYPTIVDRARVNST
ncbi:hypothetical protein PAXRUDRAFT_140379 [Paxillus rubicundulus Ve08.2h10]|uniref:HAT C-terminal dimerisation domain-containing protein n=1 Tax=Paxillus rubicundulus Ve08.2h10 TaxID=930991 RepID=A0A0D0E3Q1_9AGAM|nr:hypothetical protein PAXRUDRAFT_140379 [Paxillus rubicundulus Ve08.2h10]